ncbi:UPF0739 protein C1orf74 homolog [Anneissia japonica]|uniref:UPF0739 protein C1orf74 homolog n=1 Tax=Anneissia japonica TaxID=1529436 RepID=UPI0014255336|nr:UPF0739 protein C1orf74 homolog [Anneissia japonica]
MIGNFFGKHAKKSWKALVSDFLYVLYGVKNGFLYDYGIIDSDSMIAFLQDFTNLLAVDTSVGGLSLRDCLSVNVIEVNENIFVVNTDILIPFLRRCLEKGYLKCIDVSGKLDEPVICTDHVISENIVKELASSLKIILDFATEGSLACNSDSMDQATLLNKPTIRKLKVDVATGCNITTLFGILIGYPIVYWYNNRDVNNCLGMVPLRVYNVKCIVHLADISGKFTMYSFSIPDSLVSCFKERIVSWFDDLQSRVKKLDEKHLFKELELESHVVVLPALTL